MKDILGIVMAFLMLSNGVALAAVQTEDFSCKGIYLGDSAEKMLAAFGTPMYDKEITVQGQHIRSYTFKDGFVVGVRVKSNKVVDMKVTNTTYEGREGIRYGATAYKIKQVYGKTNRVPLEGKTYYIYTNQTHPHQRLLVEAEPTDGYLLSTRWTSLPLTDEEAEDFSEDADWENPDLQSVLIGQKEIDMSSLPKEGQK